MMVDEGFYTALETVEDEQGRDVWKITDDQAAEWALEKIRNAQAEVEKWTDYYSRQIENVKASAENTIAFMTAKLEEYFKCVPHKESKTQEKYSLPSGDLIWKREKKVLVHDDEKLMQWIKDNGLADELIKVSEKVNWADAKKRFVETQDGQYADKETGLVCGAVWTETEMPEFKVKV